MRDDLPVQVLFEEEVVPLVAKGDDGVTPCVYGEMVDVLWTAGKVRAAVQLERLWEGLLDGHDFTLLCAYSVDEVGRHAEGDMGQVFGHHGDVSGLVPADRMQLGG